MQQHETLTSGKEAHSKGATMPKRVAGLLVGKLPEALGERRIEVADSEPYWPRSDQYNEHDGGAEPLPSMAPELMAYCKEKRLRPLTLSAHSNAWETVETIDLWVADRKSVG